MVITAQLLWERLNAIPDSLNRRKIKKLSNELIKELQPTVESYNKIYLADEDMNREVAWQLDQFIKMMADGDLTERIFLAQAQEAFRLDKDKAQKEIHSILLQ